MVINQTIETSFRFERSKIGPLLSKEWGMLGYATTCFLLITMLAPVEARTQFQREMETHGLGVRRRLAAGYLEVCTVYKCNSWWGKHNQCIAAAATDAADNRRVEEGVRV